MAVDLKTLSPDTSLPQSGFLFGADSQAVSSPSVFSVPTVKDAINSGVVTLTDAAFISWDVTEAPVARVTLGGNRTLFTPSNIKDGGIYRLYAIQDATGGRTLAYEPTFKWTGGTAPDFSTATAGQIYLLTFWSDGVSLYGSVSSAYDGFAPSIVANFASTIWDVAPPSWLDYSGTTGNRMYVDSTGKLTYAPNNLLLNTATLSTQSVTTAAINYILSFKGTGSVAISGAYSGSLAGTGAANRVSLAFTSTAASLTLTVTGTVTEAQLEAVTYQTTPSTYVATTSAAYYGPRFDYDPVTLQPKGLLVEGTRTNLCTYSQQLDNVAWTQTSTTVTPDATVAPNGGTSYKVLTTVNTYSNTYYSATITVVAGSVYTVSVYLKSGVGTGVQLRMTDIVTGQCLAQINPATGSISVFSASVYGTVTVSSQNVGNGWYRYTMTGTQPAGQTTARVGLYLQNTNDYVFAWGFQLEAGSFATSYIPTTTAQVTRAADVLKASGAAKTILSATTGTAIMQARVASIASYVNLLGDASRVLLWADASTTLKSSSTTPSPVALSATIGGAGTWTGGAVRAAVSWSAAGRSIVANNGTVASDSNTFGTATDVPIFLVGNGTIESMALYSINLPDAVEKTKSTVGAPY